MAVFTVLLWFVSRDQKDLAREAIRHNQVTERAYVNVRAFVLRPLVAQEGIAVDFEIFNGGPTPATITSYRIGCWYGQGKDRPTIDAIPNQPESVGAVLVPQDGATFAKEFSASTPDQTLIDEIQSGETRLWILGYVAYRDVFGEETKLMFGRIWLPSREEHVGLSIRRRLQQLHQLA
jgi:hypothetical protein